MIISVEKKFIFVANLKTASTSIESSLRPHGDIVVRRSELGKHLPFSDIQSRFSWLFNAIPEENFFKFGVIRDPLGYMLSLYRSHRDDKFKGNEKLYTGGMSFDEFLEKWVPKNSGQVQPQAYKFIDKNGFLALDKVLLYENIEKSFSETMYSIGLHDIKLPKMNVSPETDVEVTEYAKQWVKSHFEKDYKVIQEQC